jgi:toxin ParE1/3/4
VARRVRWLRDALRDLEEAADYIARDSRFYSAAFVREARDAANSLRTLSRRGRVVPEIGDPNVRELFVHSHRLIYRVVGQDVEVLALIHGARDLRRLLEGS